MNLLLLSNSTNPGEPYLGYPKQSIDTFLGDIRENIIFIPYAAVTFSWDEYTLKVNEALSEIGVRVKGIHKEDDLVNALKDAKALMVGGGNSFQLLNLMYENRLMEVIRDKVGSGTPYIGWSAGSNMACPTLKTTNDMPIVEPPSFRALNLIPFQINPHYTDEVIPNHGGESREMRILEFVEANKGVLVVGLPEGMIIKIQNDNYQLIGNKPVRIFQYGKGACFIQSSEEFNTLISKL